MSKAEFLQMLSRATSLGVSERPDSGVSQESLKSIGGNHLYSPAHFLMFETPRGRLWG